jgi:hypothetical protein
MSDPETIAKGLTDAQRRALVWSCLDGKVHPLQVEGIDQLGLVTFSMEPVTPSHHEGFYWPTPLGIAVREVLERKS